MISRNSIPYDPNELPDVISSGLHVELMDLFNAQDPDWIQKMIDEGHNKRLIEPHEFSEEFQALLDAQIEADPDWKNDPDWREHAYARSEMRKRAQDDEIRRQLGIEDDAFLSDKRAADIVDKLDSGRLKSLWIYGDYSHTAKLAGHIEQLFDNRHRENGGVIACQCVSWQWIRDNVQDKEYLASLRKCKLFILTGIGDCDAESWLMGELVDIARDRMRRQLPTISVSQLVPSQWGLQAAQTASSTIVNALIDALQHGGKSSYQMIAA